MADVAITESANPLTANIDVADPLAPLPPAVVRLLRVVDAQIFSGWAAHESVYDVADVIVRVAEKGVGLLSLPRSAIVFSGCGTSGRLAFLVARTFSTQLSLSGHSRCLYLIAGGDRALFHSSERTEDSWSDGVRKLEEVTEGLDKVLYFGISCGLSAPFVAGQLDHCLSHSDKFTAVLLGFNPVSMARKVDIEDSSMTFHDVAMAMKKRHELMDSACFIMNPVLGPEAITGSTRMKGGSATKTLLETTLSLICRGISDQQIQRNDVMCLLHDYEVTYRHTYFQSVAIATIMQMAGDSLCAGGHIYYVSTEDMGMLALIDASECPPTFGAGPGDVRAFIWGGYSTIGNRDGDLSKHESQYCIGWGDFTSQVLPHLTPHDCVVVVAGATANGSGDVARLCASLSSSGCGTALLTVGDETQLHLDHSMFESHMKIKLPWKQLSGHASGQMLCGAAVKWVLNAVSTGAHLQAGKVLGNRMVDLQVSNSKLYHRAVGIVQGFSGLGWREAELCVLGAIHRQHPPEPGVAAERLASQLHAARGRTKVVPVALLLATGRYSVCEAERALQLTPVLRRVLAAAHDDVMKIK